MEIGLFLLRVVIGLLFVGHGTQKLFGWFGGPGPEGTAQMMDQLGYQPRRPAATAGGLAEAGGGTMLVLGLLTPFAALAIVAMMVNAIGSVHASNGLWNTEGGFEFPMVMATGATTLAFTGPGGWSIDEAIGDPFAADLWGWIALTVGIAGGLLALASRRTEPAASDAAPTERDRAA
jgi:putative oxidoreductase